MLRVCVVLCLLVGLGYAEPARAEDLPAETKGWPRDLLDALIHGKPVINVRGRIEGAKIDGSDESYALTVRTRLGYGTKPFKGFSVYADFENISAADDDSYFDGVSRPNGETLIADPTDTDFNQYYLKAELGLDTTLIGGRQRIILDDARWVGNVGWRQNEQTYDAAWGSTGLGIEGLEISYAYVYEVLRIFGDQGGPSTQDYDSDSHLMRVVYDRFPCARFVAFAYLLDFSDTRVPPPGTESNSFGFRLTGDLPFAEKWKASYIGSYAYQSDSGDRFPDYDAHYYNVEGALGHESVGTLGVGYEVLGSDDGKARVVTPLATGHKFNGFADAFLDNGGVIGLRDLYVYVAPSLPYGFKGKLFYHYFESDHGGVDFGHEFDAVLSRPITKYVIPLFKVAYYDAIDKEDSRPDRWRVWFEVTLKY